MWKRRRAERATWEAYLPNDDDKGYGRSRAADTTVREYVAEPLIVFIHGILGDCIKTWGATPSTVVRDGAGLEANVFSFNYPAGLFQDADVRTAARDLAELLRNRFPKF